MDNHLWLIDPHDFPCIPPSLHALWRQDIRLSIPHWDANSNGVAQAGHLRHNPLG